MPPDFITILIGTNDASATFNEKNATRYVKNQNLPRVPNRNWYQESLTAIISTSGGTLLATELIDGFLAVSRMTKR